MAIRWLVELVLLAALLGLALWTLALRRRLRQLPRPAAGQPLAQDELPALFQVVTQAIDLGVALVDARQRVRFANRRCAELLGRQTYEVLGRGTIVLLRDYEADHWVRQALQEHEEREAIFRPVLGSRTLNLHIVPLQDGGLLLLIRDLTRLSELERARRDLLANVSHELRTPLASLQLLLETLQTGPPPQLAQRMQQQMQDEIRVMTRLLDDLHKLAEIESGLVMLKLQPVSVRELVERVLGRISPQAEQQQLRLAAEVQPQLPAALVDPPRIEQVLLNLLHNAVKFTPAGGEVRLEACLPAARLAAELPPGAWLQLTVSDTGPGIPQSDLPRIFERFYKIDRARTRGGGGTGLGLAIARHLVEGHGGRIWAESTPGQGTRFHLLLPAAQEPAQALPDSEPFAASR